MANIQHSSSGFCDDCQSSHHLPEGNAKRAARDLMKQLDSKKRLDLQSADEEADPRFSTDYLFGEARGKMFGVLVCRKTDNALVTLKAFSGQYNGEWEIEGWAPPLFDLRQWRRINDGPEKEIKRLGAKIDAAGPGSLRGRKLIEERKRRSGQLMKELHRPNPPAPVARSPRKRARGAHPGRPALRKRPRGRSHVPACV